MTKRQRQGLWLPPKSLLRELEEEGKVEGLSKSAARFNGVLMRCLGVKPSPASPKWVEQLNDFDSKMRAAAKAEGLELHDDD